MSPKAIPLVLPPCVCLPAGRGQRHAHTQAGIPDLAGGWHPCAAKRLRECMPPTIVSEGSSQVRVGLRAGTCLRPGPGHSPPPGASGPSHAATADLSPPTPQPRACVTEKCVRFDKSSSHVLFTLGGVTMVMRSDENRSLVQAALKCTWQLGVVEKGVNFRGRACCRKYRACHRPSVAASPPGPHTLLQAELISSSCNVCFACDFLPLAAALVTGTCR